MEDRQHSFGADAVRGRVGACVELATLDFERLEGQARNILGKSCLAIEGIDAPTYQMKREHNYAWSICEFAYFSKYISTPKFTK